MGENKERMSEFIEAVKPIHDWLCKYGDPYTTVMVTQDWAQATDSFIGIPLEVPD